MGSNILKKIEIDTKTGNILQYCLATFCMEKTFDKYIGGNADEKSSLDIDGGGAGLYGGRL